MNTDGMKTVPFMRTAYRKEHIMNDIMKFADREEFREWLSRHCRSDEGVWLLFGIRI